MARRFNRKPLTDEQRDARRKADRERIEQAARALLTTDGWQRWIKVRASNGLSRYSLSNQCIVSMEAHTRGFTPTYVAGFRAFLALNRVVRRGERAIRILAKRALSRLMRRAVLAASVASGGRRSPAARAADEFVRCLRGGRSRRCLSASDGTSSRLMQRRARAAGRW